MNVDLIVFIRFSACFEFEIIGINQKKMKYKRL